MPLSGTGAPGMGLVRTRKAKKNPTVMPCITVPLNLLETGGTVPGDFRLPVKACRLSPMAKVPGSTLYGSRTLFLNTSMAG